MPSVLISCPHCGLIKNISEKKIPYRRVKVTCTRCSESFLYEKPPRIIDVSKVRSLPFFGQDLYFDEDAVKYNDLRALFQWRSGRAVNSFNVRFEEEIVSPVDFLSKSKAIGHDCIVAELQDAVRLLEEELSIGVEADDFMASYDTDYNKWDVFCGKIEEQYLAHSDDTQARTALGEGVRQAVFDIHYALADALSIEYPDAAARERARVDLGDIRGREITDAERHAELAEIISLYPYLKESYEYALVRFGDHDQEIARLCDFLGVEILPFKNELLSEYYDSLGKQTEDQLLDARWYVKKKAVLLGVEKYQEIIEDIEERLLGIDVAARTVAGVLFVSREEAAKGAGELQDIQRILSQGDSSTEDGAQKLLYTLKNEKFLTLVAQRSVQEVQAVVDEFDRKALALKESKPNPRGESHGADRERGFIQSSTGGEKKRRFTELRGSVKKLMGKFFH